MKAYKTYQFLKNQIKRNLSTIKYCEEENKEYQKMLDEVLEERK